MLNSVKAYLIELQHNICSTIEEIDGSSNFKQDQWQHDQGGGGITRILTNGHVFAKAGVNFSEISGSQLPPSATIKRPELKGASFKVAGLSLVIHPDNPYVPTAHANLRFFIAQPASKKSKPIWWFGGGMDLTPYYGFIEDCQHWHQIAKKACDPFGKEVYPKFKHWCDQYFYIKHRQEPRGIGGLFFDDLNAWGFDRCFSFVQSVGDHFLLAYQPIAQRRKQMKYGQREKTFQHIRRGRYVEFNLVYDRGTLFGLQSGGRTESILMSLPPEVSWPYNWQAEENSVEARFVEDFLSVRNWV